MRRPRGGRLGLVVIALSLVACSPTLVVGTPSGSTSRETAPGSGTSFDPCSDISASSLSLFGLDPSTKNVSVVQTAGLGKGCGWTNPQVSLDVLVTDQTVGDLAARRAFTNVTLITVGGRDSVQFQVDPQRTCDVGMSSQATAVIVSLSINFSSIGLVDACATALDIATKLAPTLPE